MKMNSASRNGVQPRPDLLDELDGALSEVADALRSFRAVLVASEQENDAADHQCEHGDERDLVERIEEIRPPEDGVHLWELESFSEHVEPILCVKGGKA
jgi:hypothetical protein